VPGMRDYTDEELELVRKSFGGCYALRDRCYFEMALQMGLRMSETLSLTVGQVYQYGKVADEVSIERKHMKGGKAGKASGRPIPLFPETHPHILAWLVRMAAMLHVKIPRRSIPQPRFSCRVSATRTAVPGRSPMKPPGALLKRLPERMSSPARWARIAPGRPWRGRSTRGRTIFASCNVSWAIGAWRVPRPI
jgi:hypothetical protein